MACQLDSFKSADKIIEDGSIDIYLTKYLNPIDVSNLSPHDLSEAISSVANKSSFSDTNSPTRLHEQYSQTIIQHGELISSLYAHGDRHKSPQIDPRIYACRPKTVSIERWQPNVRHAPHQTRSRVHNLAILAIVSGNVINVLQRFTFQLLHFPSQLR
jgi:hypothetical protein